MLSQLCKKLQAWKHAERANELSKESAEVDGKYKF